MSHLSTLATLAPKSGVNRAYKRGLRHFSSETALGSYRLKAVNVAAHFLASCGYQALRVPVGLGLALIPNRRQAYIRGVMDSLGVTFPEDDISHPSALNLKLYWGRDPNGLEHPMPNAWNRRQRTRHDDHDIAA